MNRTKNTFLVGGTILLAALCFTASIAFAETNDRNAEWIDFLKNKFPPVLSAAIEDAIAPLHKSFVGIGIVFEVTTEMHGREVAVGVVTEVFKKGPADRADVRVGDVIVAANGARFNSTESFKKTILGDGKPGQRVRLSFYRRGVEFQVEMVTVLFGLRKDQADIIESALRLVFGGQTASIQHYSEIVIKKLEAAQNIDPATDPDVEKLREALDEFDAYLDKMDLEIKKLKGLQ